MSPARLVKWIRAAFSGPLETPAARAAAASAGLLTAVALLGASIRVLPWLVDPRVPWRVALPFGRAVASVAVEAAVLVGWPIGWALAAFVVAERGEGRVLAMLGERPARTVVRLLPWACVFGAILAGASLAGGRDASEPGRVVADLLRGGRASCATAGAPRAVEVPLVGAEWLCTPGAGARLVGRPPFAHGDPPESIYTAASIDVAPDARRIELDDAWIATPAATVHVNHVVFRLPPFVRASSLAGRWRALLLASAAAASALLAVGALLAMDQRGLVLWRLHAIAVGGAGPVSALALLHTLERASAPMPIALYALLPVAAVAATLALVLLVSGLPGVRATATS